MNTGVLKPTIVPAPPERTQAPRLKLWQRALLVIAAATSFHLAFLFEFLSGLVLLYAFCLIQISLGSIPCNAFRASFLAGFLVFAPHLAWFWSIFGAMAICLWAVLAFFTALFTAILSASVQRFGAKWVSLLAPVLWTGLEYFRGELYVLKFSWLSAAHVFSSHSGLIPFGTFGVYGIGFLIFFLAALGVFLPRRIAWAAVLGDAALISLLAIFPMRLPQGANYAELRVAGIQLEFPPELSVPMHLDKVIAKQPEAEIVVLSEYTFDGPVPSHVREWCRKNQRHLVAGGKTPIEGGGFYNTAFVISPKGEIVFQQAKSVPIQFFNDGEPAQERKLWDSPWGKLAVPICYDLSYRRVMDDYIRQGAQGIIVPFMDVTEWGEYQHILHARNTSIRAQEYQLPIFRLGSSGISQHVSPRGQVLAAAPFPGQEEIFAGTMHLQPEPNLPLDTWLAPACSVASGVLILAAFTSSRRKWSA